MQQCNALKAPHYPGGGGEQEMFVCRRKIHLEDKLLEENELGDVAATAATTFGSSLLFGRRRGWLYVRKYTTCYSTTDESPSSSSCYGQPQNAREAGERTDERRLEQHNKRRRPQPTVLYRRNKPEVVDPYCSDSPMHLSWLCSIAALSLYFLLGTTSVNRLNGS